MNAKPALKAVDTAAERASTAPHVLQAIAGVIEDIAREGIAKDRANAQQGYKFRGIDDVYNALSPFLAKHALIITPRGKRRDVVERTSAKGAPLFYVTVEMEYDFASAVDGSSIIVGPMFGEAMDSADKATNKAQSAAYKYMAMQAFCIPTEGDNDADATTHEAAYKPDVRGLIGAATAAISIAATRAEGRAWQQNNADFLAKMERENLEAFNEIVRFWKAHMKSLPAEEAAATPASKADSFAFDDTVPF